MADRRVHPEAAELLRYCDGELRPRETERVTRHLEACWDCRTRLDDLRHAIAEYVRYRRDVLEPSQPPPPRPWPDLRAEFARVPAPENSHPAWKRIFERRAVWLLACTLTAATGILFYTAKERTDTVARPVQPPVPLPSAQRASPPPMPVAPPPAPRKAPPSPGPEDELRAIAALDRIGADLGDPIEVVRTPSRIVVTCIGLDSERLRQVRGALAGLPRVAVELSPKPSVSAATLPLDIVGTPHPPFDSPAAHEKFVDGLLKSSEAMMARAHALRQLAARFPADVESRMGPDATTLLAAIRANHEAALARELSSLDRSVRPFLAPPPPPASRSSRGLSHEDWQTRTLRVFSEAGQVDRLLGAVFAGSQSAPSGEATPGALSAALARLESDVPMEPR